MRTAKLAVEGYVEVGHIGGSGEGDTEVALGNHLVLCYPSFSINALARTIIISDLRIAQHVVSPAGRT